MKEQIKRILIIQKSFLLGIWTAPILLAVLYETGIFQKGIQQGNAQMELLRRL